jgi:hypothetical protein
MSSLLTEGAHNDNSASSLLEESKDGLDNKDRWHWKERDLREWVNQWLMRAFVQFDKGILFEDEDMTARVTTIRGDYEAQEGEAFLNWRKGKCFATYHFGIRLEFQGTLRVDGRIIGQSKGVLRINDIKYDDSDEEDNTRSPSLLQGAWEVSTPGQQHEAGNKGLPERKPETYEEIIKEVMGTDRGLGPVREKLAILRRCLTELTTSEEVSKGSLPDATLTAQRAMECEKERKEAEVRKSKGEMEGVTEEMMQAAEETAKAYVTELRISNRSDRFVKVLEDVTLTEMNINLCDLRPGKDIDDLVTTLKQNKVVTLLDMRDNFSLNDIALQPLLIALASGAAPLLKRIRLGGTGVGVMSRNMATGLTMMRKGLVVEFDDEKPMN